MTRPPVAVRYRITPANPRAHLFEVELEIETPAPEGQRLQLPVWIPGSYLVREFARNIVEISAKAAGEPVALEVFDTPLALDAGRLVALRFLRAGAERGPAPEKRKVTLRFRAVVDQDN